MSLFSMLHYETKIKWLHLGVLINRPKEIRTKTGNLELKI